MAMGSSESPSLVLTNDSTAAPIREHGFGKCSKQQAHACIHAKIYPLGLSQLLYSTHSLTHSLWVSIRQDVQPQEDTKNNNANTQPRSQKT